MAEPSGALGGDLGLADLLDRSPFRTELAGCGAQSILLPLLSLQISSLKGETVGSLWRLEHSRQCSWPVPIAVAVCCPLAGIRAPSSGWHPGTQALESTQDGVGLP